MSLRDPFKRGENWYCEVNRKRVSLKTKDKTEAMARFREIRKRYYEHLAGAPLVIEMTFGDFADEYEHWAEDAVESRKTLSANLLALHKLLAVVPRSLPLSALSKKPAGVYRKYPHELSGGMLQRAMIATAVVARPKLLLLDEPTTALDVTIQAQILELLKKLNRESGISMLFISHNLNVVRKLCTRTAVMQRGVLVEEGDIETVFRHPRHPYTQRLIAAIPTRHRKEETP